MGKFDILKEKALQIKNESEPGMNTAERVGNAILESAVSIEKVAKDFTDFITKTNQDFAKISSDIDKKIGEVNADIENLSDATDKQIEDVYRDITGYRGVTKTPDELNTSTKTGIYYCDNGYFAGLLSVQVTSKITISQIALSSCTPVYDIDKSGNTYLDIWEPMPNVITRTYTNGKWSDWAISGDKEALDELTAKVKKVSDKLEELGPKVSELALNVYGEKNIEIDLSTRPASKNYFIDSDKWKTDNASYTASLIEVSEGQVYNITGGNDVGSKYAFLIDQDIKNGVAVIYVGGTGMTTLGAGENIDLTIPPTTKWMYIRRKAPSADYTPSSIMLYGKERTVAYKNEIDSLGKSIDDIKDVVGEIKVVAEEGVPITSSANERYIRRDASLGFFYIANAKTSDAKILCYDVKDCEKVHLSLPPITTGDSFISWYVFSNVSEWYVEKEKGKIRDLEGAKFVPATKNVYLDIDVEVPTVEKFLWVTVNPNAEYSVKLYKTKVEGGIYNERIDNLENNCKSLSKDVEELKKKPIDNMALFYTDELNMIQSFGRIGEKDDKLIPTLNFLHISDTHVGGPSNRIGTECVEIALSVLNGNSVVSNPKPSFLLHTGDMIYTNFNDSFESLKQLFLESAKNVYFCLGNHDVGDKNIIAQYGTLAQTNERYFVPIIDKWALKTDGGGTPHISGKNYYFQDFTSQKIRLIVLCDFDMDSVISSTDPTKYAYHMDYKVYSQQQIDWFVDAISTMPEGYGFIVAKHMPEEQVPYKSDEAFEDNAFFCQEAHGSYNGMTHSDGWQSIICDIIDAYINKESKNISMNQENIAVSGAPNMVLTANVNFTNRADSSEFICMCTGHSHRDTIQFHKRHPKILNLNIGANNCAYYGWDMQQTLGTKSGAVINAYSVNRNTGTITIVRVGANFSAYGQKRDTLTLSYRR